VISRISVFIYIALRRERKARDEKMISSRSTVLYYISVWTIDINDIKGGLQ